MLYSYVAHHNSRTHCSYRILQHLVVQFGNPISHFPELQKLEARERIESELASVFKNLSSELQQTFRLTIDDLPHPPRERMAGNPGAQRRPEAAAQHPCGMGVV